MFTLPELSYSLTALEPFLSKKQMELHYHKHHQGYVDKLNAIIRNGPIQYSSLEEIIKFGSQYPPNNLYNNAAQVWNHNFYWKSMTPNMTSPSHVSMELNYLIEYSFGSVNSLANIFVQESMKHFGSGWTWLLWDGGGEKDHLSIITTHDAICPITSNCIVPLFNCDLWEHAFYVSFENRKEEYLQKFIANLVNWAFAAENYKNRKPRVENGKSFFNS